LNFSTNFISESGKWYSNSTILRLQTDAFFRGSIALDSVPDDIDDTRCDFVRDHGIQQVWGLGVPAFRFIFELPAKVFGFASFPDRITFLIACFMCFVFLLVTFANGHGVVDSESGRKTERKMVRILWILGLIVFIPPFITLINTRLVRIFWILGLMVFAPPFITLISTRFEVYEEVVAYGYLYGLVLFAALLHTAQSPTTRKMLFLSTWAGLGIFIRPTLLFYGVVTMVLALVIAWRAQMRLRVITGMLLLFCFCGALLGLSNWSRFGAFSEFGHALNLTPLNHNTFSLKFDYPFRNEPLLSAVRDELGTLFFVRRLNGFDFYQQGVIWGQSATYRWHEMYFTTFNALHLYLFAASGLLWLWNFKRVHLIWSNFSAGLRSAGKSGAHQFDSAYALFAAPWAVASFACLFGFYLWSPSMASRYNVDFLPAVMIGISALVWNAFEFNLIPETRTAALIGCSATMVWLVFGIVTADISPSHQKREPLDSLAVGRRMHAPSNENTTPILTHYELGATSLVGQIPDNGDGWNLQNGALRPVVTLFASDPKCVVLSLFAPEGAIDPDDLAPIQAKIGLEYLLRKSTEVHSNKAVLVFRGPQKSRYQTGLQVCFLGFIRPQDLGRKDPGLRLASVSFAETGAISTNQASAGVRTEH
jgi:hypothetical protein